MHRIVFVTLCGLAAAGCGSGLNTAPVSGVITKDGQPLPDVSVSFIPQTQSIESPISNGRTDASGRYVLTVTTTGDTGAVVGNHTVRIAFIEPEREGPDVDISDPNLVDPVPPHDLTFEVKPGSNEANFDLKSR